MNVLRLLTLFLLSIQQICKWPPHSWRKEFPKPLDYDVFAVAGRDFERDN
jgi:hypothetical protein